MPIYAGTQNAKPTFMFTIRSTKIDQALNPSSRRCTNLTCIFDGPVLRGLVMFLPVLLVELSYLRNQWVIRVRVCEEGADGEENFRDRQRRAPVVLKNVQTNSTLIVHIAVVDLGLKLNLRRFERVVLRECNFQEEYPVLVRAISWAHNCSLPFEEIIYAEWSSRAALWRVLVEVGKFFFDTLERHGFSTVAVSLSVHGN
mmetsp:Transcript_24872/g.44241  ORF Transcript_24872/g.44241 Transcript_24872/m.44241 type:complete len:200 (+) Transcript_24872:146-745(+)